MVKKRKLMESAGKTSWTPKHSGRLEESVMESGSWYGEKSNPSRRVLIFSCACKSRKYWWRKVLVYFHLSAVRWSTIRGKVKLVWWWASGFIRWEAIWARLKSSNRSARSCTGKIWHSCRQVSQRLHSHDQMTDKCSSLIFKSMRVVTTGAEQENDFLYMVSRGNRWDISSFVLFGWCGMWPLQVKP